MNNEKPEVYAIRQDGGSWQISRRDFLKAAGIGVTAMGIALNSRLIRPASAEESLEELCKDAPAHKDNIKNLIVSADGKYLLSYSNGTLKCWDFENYTLLSSRDVTGINYMTTSMIGGRSYVVYFVSGESQLRVRELPDIGVSGDQSVGMSWIRPQLINQLDSDLKGNLYVLLLDQSHLDKKRWTVSKIETKNSGSDLLNKSESLYTSSEEILFFKVFDNEHKILITDKAHKLKVVDIAAGTAEELDVPALAKADRLSILPGETAVLYPEENAGGSAANYGMASLLEKTVVWTEKISASGSPRIHNTAVTPDGTFGLLLAQWDKQRIELISMKDGSVVKEIETGQTSNDCYDIAVSRDGSKLAIANKKSILFFSLPDLTIIGCPVDLSEMKANTEGIQVERTDAVTGKTVTYTLPCGSPIPAGAVCTCNCVSGSIPVCSCDAHTCSCQSYRPSGGGGHYWHPN